MSAVCGTDGHGREAPCPAFVVDDVECLRVRLNRESDPAELAFLLDDAAPDALALLEERMHGTGRLRAGLGLRLDVSESLVLGHGGGIDH